MASKNIVVNSILVLRIFTLLLLAASIVLMVTNNYKLSDVDKLKFTDLIAYRYVVATGCIGFLYTMVQIPFALYHAITEKRWIRNNRFLPVFDFYGDKIISFLLATGVGVGFGVSFELKRFINEFFDLLLFVGVTSFEDSRSKARNFLNKAIMATSILLAGFICMAILTKLTSIPRKK